VAQEPEQGFVAVVHAYRGGAGGWAATCLDGTLPSAAVVEGQITTA
jgi:hypothetical protein